MNEEQSIKLLSDELELPVEKVALVWATTKTLIDIDSITLVFVVRTVLGQLFPENSLTD